VQGENLERHKECAHPEHDIDEDTTSAQESLSADETVAETATETGESSGEDDSSMNEDDSSIDEESREYLLREMMASAHCVVLAREEDLPEDAYLETVRKVFLDKYNTLLKQQNELEESDIHHKVQTTIERLMDKEDYTTQEAIKYGLHKRQYLFDELLHELNPAGGGDADSSD